jgi:hypothetical protein
MIQKLKNTVSILVVVMLFLPSIIKIEHHHDHFDYPVKSGKFFHHAHEKCPVCSFEYPVFLSENIHPAIAKAELLTDTYNNCYTHCHFSDLSNYSFSLRAPPLFINNI